MDDSIAYLIMCALGAFILLIEAHRQFSSPIKFQNQSSYKILENFELEDLASQRVLLRGYLFYLGLYLLIYVILLMSLSLGDLAIGAHGQSGAKGDLPFDSVDKFFLDREGVARPIYISAAMIALLSTGWVQRVENVLRKFAHRLAGIPSDIYKTITRLNKLNYDVPVADEYLVRTGIYTEAHNGGEAGGAAEDSRRKHVLNALRQIDFVADAIVSPVRDQVFNQKDLSGISALLKKQEANMRKLDEQLRDPAISQSTLLDRIEEEKRNLQALFAVLFTKDTGVELATAHPPTEFLLEKLKRKPTDRVFNGLIGSGLLLAPLVALVLGFVIEALYFRVTGGVPFGQFPEGEYGYRAQKAAELALVTVFLFLPVGIAVAARRAHRAIEDRWAGYSLANIPFARIAWLALLPAVLGFGMVAIALALPNLVAEFRVVGWSAVGQLLAEAFGQVSAEALRYGVVALLVGAAVVMLADLHGQMAQERAYMLAVGATVIAAVVFLMLIVSDVDRRGLVPIRDAAKFFVTCLAFLLGFAFLLKKSEKGQGDV